MEIIRPLDQVRLVGILNDTPAVPVPGGLQVQLGDAYGEESRRIVFRLHVPVLAALGAARIADVVLRYVTVGDVGGAAPDHGAARHERGLVRRGGFETAQKLLKEAAGELRRTAPGSARVDELMEQVSELERFGDSIGSTGYDPTFTKKMLYSQRKSQNRRRKR